MSRPLDCDVALFSYAQDGPIDLEACRHEKAGRQMEKERNVQQSEH
jgi:hypothetical protein